MRRRPILASGGSHVVARKIVEQAARARTELDELQKKHEREIAAAQERLRAEQMSLWARLLELQGLPKSQALEWGIDARYLDDLDLLFLVPVNGTPCPDCGHDHSGDPEDFGEALRRLFGHNPDDTTH